MKKQSFSLAQLCMMFNQTNAKYYCIGRDVFEFDWQADFVFGLPDRTKNLKFVHCPERPSNSDCAYFLSFETEENHEEFFMIRGDNNKVLASFCDMFVQFAKLIRAHNYKHTDSKNAAVQECLSDSFILDTTELGTPSARTEFVWKTDNSEFVLAKFDKMLDLPYDHFEQRKVDNDNNEQSWEWDEDCFLSNNRQKTFGPLSEIIVRYVDPEGEAEPIEIPLRIDSSELPVWLFDFTLLLGLDEPTEEAEIEGNEAGESDKTSE